MNGLTDVRLTLRQHELAQPAATLRVVARPVMAAPIGSRWAMFWQRLRTRRALLTLTDAQLADIGISRADANYEAMRPFWTL